MKAFESYLLSECGYSTLTARDYLSILGRVNQWLQAQGVKNIDAAQPEDARAFLRALSGRNLASTTISKAASAIITYWRFIGRGPADIDAIERPRVPLQLPALPNQAELITMIESASDLRDRAILELLYATGIRADELCNLTIGDLTPDWLMVRQGKGAKDRPVPCGRAARGAVAAYLFTRRDAQPTDAMFLTHGSTGAVTTGPRQRPARSGPRPMTYISLHGIVQKYAKRTRQRVPVTPHTFRHCFATHMLMSGNANLREIQVMMGHESLEATARYLHLDVTHLKREHTLRHPRERMARGLPATIPIGSAA